MLLNLSKSFSFEHEKDLYQIGYFFSRDPMSGDPLPAQNIWMVLTVSLNDSVPVSYTVQKPTKTLYLQNEQIELIIREEAISLSSQTVA